MCMCSCKIFETYYSVHNNEETCFLYHSKLVVAIHRDIPHPWKRLVAALFDNFQIANLNARYSEIRNFELDTNRCSPMSCVFALDRRQTEVSSHEVFPVVCTHTPPPRRHVSFSVRVGENKAGEGTHILGTGELLDRPDDSISVREVSDSSNGRLEGRRINV